MKIQPGKLSGSDVLPGNNDQTSLNAILDPFSLMLASILNNQIVSTETPPLPETASEPGIDTAVSAPDASFTTETVDVNYPSKNETITSKIDTAPTTTRNNIINDSLNELNIKNYQPEITQSINLNEKNNSLLSQLKNLNLTSDQNNLKIDEILSEDSHFARVDQVKNHDLVDKILNNNNETSVKQSNFQNEKIVTPSPDNERVQIDFSLNETVKNIIQPVTVSKMKSVESEELVNITDINSSQDQVTDLTSKLLKNNKNLTGIKTEDASAKVIDHINDQVKRSHDDVVIDTIQPAQQGQQFSNNMMKSIEVNELASQAPDLAQRYSKSTGETVEQEVKFEIINSLKNNSQDDSYHVLIKIYPPELGQVVAKLHMDQGNSSLVLLADNNHVKDILQTNMPQLREELKQAGIQVNHVQVDINTNAGNTSGEQSSSSQQGQAYDAEIRDTNQPKEQQKSTNNINNLIDTYA